MEAKGVEHSLEGGNILKKLCCKYTQVKTCIKRVFT